MPLNYKGYELSEPQVAGIQKIVDAMLVTAGTSLPTGGSAGQALVKNSPTPYDSSWQTIAVGGGGGGTGDVDGGVASSVYTGSGNIDGGTA